MGRVHRVPRGLRCESDAVMWNFIYILSACCWLGFAVLVWFGIEQHPLTNSIAYLLVALQFLKWVE